MVNGTLINYFFHCKTQCWLYANRLNMEYNSQKVKIGKTLHKIHRKRVKEVRFSRFSVDRITKEYVIEIKKSDSHLESGKWQLLFYLYRLKQKGVIKKGRLEVFEKNRQDKKRFELVLDKKKEERLKRIIKDIEKLISTPYPPKPVLEKKCDKCAYYEYCFV